MKDIQESILLLLKDNLSDIFILDSDKTQCTEMYFEYVIGPEIMTALSEYDLPREENIKHFAEIKRNMIIHAKNIGLVI